MVVDWSKINKEDYLFAMERSPVKDTEIRILLQNALTDKTNDRQLFMKGIDTSYQYEGYNTYSINELDNKQSYYLYIMCNRSFANSYTFF